MSAEECMSVGVNETGKANVRRGVQHVRIRFQSVGKIRCVANPRDVPVLNQDGSLFDHTKVPHLLSRLEWFSTAADSNKLPEIADQELHSRGSIICGRFECGDRFAALIRLHGFSYGGRRNVQEPRNKEVRKESSRRLRMVVGGGGVVSFISWAMNDRESRVAWEACVRFRSFAEKKTRIVRTSDLRCKATSLAETGLQSRIVCHHA